MCTDTDSDDNGVGNAACSEDDNADECEKVVTTKPGLHDVLLGRGGGTNNHEGNIKFRKLVNEHKMRYIASSKIEKPKVAREVVKLWREMNPPGRFLARKDDTKRGPGSIKDASNEWYEVGDKKAREKASQCLRERIRTPAVHPSYMKQDQLLMQQLQLQQQQEGLHQDPNVVAVVSRSSSVNERPNDCSTNPNGFPNLVHGAPHMQQVYSSPTPGNMQGGAGASMVSGVPGQLNQLSNPIQYQLHMQAAQALGADFPLYLEQQRHLENMRREGSSNWKSDTSLARPNTVTPTPAIVPSSPAYDGRLEPIPLPLQQEQQQQQLQLQLQQQQLRLQQQSSPVQREQKQNHNLHPNVPLSSPVDDELAFDEIANISSSEQKEPNVDDYDDDWDDGTYEEDLFDEKEDSKKPARLVRRRSRVKRTTSSKSTSIMSVVTQKSMMSSLSHISGLDSFDGMSMDMLTEREAKMAEARNLGSNMSLMSELTDISHGLETLTLCEDQY